MEGDTPARIFRDPARLDALRESGLMNAPAVEAMDRLTRVAAMALGVAAAQVNLITDHRQITRSSNGPGAPPAGREVPLAASYCKHAVAADEPVVVEDTRSDPRVRDNPATEELGIAAYAGVPIRNPEGQVLGTLCVYDHRPRRWTPAELDLLRDLAGLATGDVGARVRDTRHRRAEEGYDRLLEELEMERARLEAVLEYVPVGIVLATAPEGRIVMGNRRVEEIFRHPVYFSEDVDAYRKWIAFHPDGRQVEGHEYPLARAIATGEPAEGEYLYQRGDGTRAWVRIIGAPIHDRAGEITGGVVAIVDIDRQKRTEQALRESEERYRLVTRATNDLVWDWNLLTDEVRWSEAVYHVLGYSEEQVERTAQWWYDHIHPDDAERVVHGIHAVIDGGEAIWEGEYRFRRADGSYADIYDRGYVVQDAADRPVRMIGAMQDVTERRRAQAEREHLLQQVQSERTLLRQVFENAPAVMALYSGPKHIITLVNPTWERTVGKPNAVGRRFREVFPEFRDTGLFEQLDRIYRTGEPYSNPEVNVPLERWDSGVWEDTFWNLVWLPLSPGEDGERDILAHAVEVTDQVHARKTVEAANRAKSDFLATMSHELRTPLNAMLGYTELLAMGLPVPIPEPAREHVTRIGLSARHLLRIIEEILSFSRMDAGRETVDRAPVDLGELVREVAAIIEPLAQEKGLRFETDAANIPARLQTDGGKLRQILVNLLGNAVKFTDRGEVELSVAERDGELLFRVRDTGIGIAPEDQDKLWEPFWQADQSNRRKAGGTGLGLAVSRRLARLLGGDLVAESTPGEGSTFILTLPGNEE